MTILGKTQILRSFFYTSGIWTGGTWS